MILPVINIKYTLNRIFFDLVFKNWENIKIAKCGYEYVYVTENK